MPHTISTLIFVYLEFKLYTCAYSHKIFTVNVCLFVDAGHGIYRHIGISPEEPVPITMITELFMTLKLNRLKSVGGGHNFGKYVIDICTGERSRSYI